MFVCLFVCLVGCLVVWLFVWLFLLAVFFFHVRYCFCVVCFLPFILFSLPLAFYPSSIVVRGYVFATRDKLRWRGRAEGIRHAVEDARGSSVRNPRRPREIRRHPQVSVYAGRPRFDAFSDRPHKVKLAYERSVTKPFTTYRKKCPT